MWHICLYIIKFKCLGNKMILKFNDNNLFDINDKKNLYINMQF